VLRELSGWDGVVSSALLEVEALRACARYDNERVERARVGLQGVSLVPLDGAVLRLAANLPPPGLRSLDALHLATALSLEADLGVMVVYDRRLADAASGAGVAVAAPT